jgi:hypothetical protein
MRKKISLFGGHLLVTPKEAATIALLIQQGYFDKITKEKNNAKEN